VKNITVRRVEGRSKEKRNVLNASPETEKLND
jgi:hypothetical protein